MPDSVGDVFDAAAFVGPWPFRDLPDTDSEALRRRLEAAGVGRALVSPLEALFHADPQPVNERWARRLAGDPFFRFAPVLNPALPGWERALTAWGNGRAAAIRLFPNYHGYATADAETLVRAAGALDLPVVIQPRMQDMRLQHPRAPIPDLDWRPALELARLCPQTRFLFAGARWTEADKLRAEEMPGNVYLELSNMELVDGLRRFLDRHGPARLLCGTHAPLFTPAALRLRLETARLTPEEREALARGNARGLGVDR